MRALISPHGFSGSIRIPASKSHTIRRLLIAALARGVSEIEYPLDSLDARSCVSVCRALGAVIGEDRAVSIDGGAGGIDGGANPADSDGTKLVRWTVRGTGAGSMDGGAKGMGSGAGSAAPGVSMAAPKVSMAALDVGNSGTTLFLALAAAALGSSPVSFTGDEQIRRRSAAPLLAALAGLGIKVSSASGCAPITVCGPWKGGRVSLECPTSQYLSALLLAAPLAPAGVLTEIEVPLLNERPYVEMTLAYLEAQGVPFEGAADCSSFHIPGGASYKPMNGPVPGDFSSAAFPAAAAAITGGALVIQGLDPRDPQGDKAFFDMLVRMGCEVQWGADQSLTVSRQSPLRGGTFDLNATPDLLPVMAVMGAYAEGETALVNAAHARIKETDRIAVMAEELGKLGVPVEERPDGLVIRGEGGDAAGGPGWEASGQNDRRLQVSGPNDRKLQVSGHRDHRVVMALAVAALGGAGPLEITGAESADVTYPGFLQLLNADILA
jgi:3-phosphoshikimate 1-carboxyvinyltransferase